MKKLFPILMVILFISSCTLFSSGRDEYNISDWFPAYQAGDIMEYTLLDSVTIFYDDTLVGHVVNYDDEEYSIKDSVLSSDNRIVKIQTQTEGEDSSYVYYILEDKENGSILLSADSIISNDDTKLLDIPVVVAASWDCPGYYGETMHYTIQSPDTTVNIGAHSYNNVIVAIGQKSGDENESEILCFSPEEGIVKWEVRHHTYETRDNGWVRIEKWYHKVFILE